MKIVIEGTAKEIADLVSEVQGRPGNEAHDKLLKLMNSDFSGKKHAINLRTAFLLGQRAHADADKH